MKLKMLDLFSGIGGFSLGLEKSGVIETTAFCEIDDHCRKVLHKHWPNVVKFKDIKDLKVSEGDFDIICGGFPCQDISVAGQKKGITNETRSGLWYEYKRIIKEVKPRFVIIENVRNLLNSGLAIVIKDLHEIGYDCEWEIISARSVGACHLRERIWIVAYPNATRFQSERPELETARTERCPSSETAREIFATDPNAKRLERSRESGNVGEVRAQVQTSSSSMQFTNSDNFRFWPSFTTEEEKSEWWAEATSSFSDWWKIESDICRVDDGLPKQLDKGRVNRIKQLGNSIVPQIAEIIGNRIKEVWFKKGEVE